MLVLDGANDRAEAVEVLHLDDRGGHRASVAKRQHAVDVGLEADVALLQHAKACAHEPHGVAEPAAEGLDLFCAREVGLGDDLEQRGAGAVEVNDGVVDGLPARRFVEQLARVFFEVCARDAYPRARSIELGLAAVAKHRDLDRTLEAQGLVVLADLVGLGQIGIEVALAIEPGHLGNRAAQRETDRYGELDRPAVGHGQRTGKRQHDGVDERVGLDTLGGRRGGVAGPREHLAVRGQFDVHLEPDHQSHARDLHARTLGLVHVQHVGGVHGPMVSAARPSRARLPASIAARAASRARRATHGRWMPNDSLSSASVWGRSPKP